MLERTTTLFVLCFGAVWGACAAAETCDDRLFPGEQVALVQAFTIAAGDLNGDGIPDLVVGGRDRVIVLLGSDDAPEIAGTYPLVGDADGALALADLNDDGSLDIVTTTSGSDPEEESVAVLLGAGDGTFAGAVAYALTENVRELVIADFNGDGTVDCAVTSSGPSDDFGAVSILLGAGDGSLLPASALSAGVRPDSIAASDLDGDGRTDLLVTDATSSIVTILRGAGDGTFVEQEPLTVATKLRSIHTGDFDGDGMPDLAVASETFEGFVWTARGNGDATFEPPVPWYAGPSPEHLSIVDLDANGAPDLAVVAKLGQAIIRPTKIGLLVNDGSGAFEPMTEVVVGQYPRDIVGTDLDLDGHLDLAVTCRPGVTFLRGDESTLHSARITEPSAYFLLLRHLDGDDHLDLVVVNSGNTISVARGLGDGTFGELVESFVGGNPQAADTADLDGDGDPDLVVAYETFSGLSVLLNQGDATFVWIGNHSVLASPRTVALGDLDGDGNADAVVVSWAEDSVTVIRGNGDGTFEVGPGSSFPTANDPVTIGLADLDDDGDLDAAVGCDGELGSGAVSVLLNDGNGNLSERIDAPDAGIGAPRSIALGDLDGDGSLDLATANHEYFSGSYSVFLNNLEEGRLEPSAVGTSESGAHGIAIADLDGDGVRDLAIANSSGGSITIATGMGGGSFAAAQVHASGAAARIAAGDLDGDGLVDLVAAGHDGLSILLNESCSIADLDGDGVVGHGDLVLLLSAWGPCADCGDCPADLDHDCAVGMFDLLALLTRWD